MGLLLFIPLRNRTASLGSVFLPAFRGPKILRVKKILLRPLATLFRIRSLGISANNERLNPVFVENA
jgi:hypothetical protein